MPFPFHSCVLGRKHTKVHRRKPAKSGSSPPSDLPDTDRTRRIGIRNAAASGSGHLFFPLDGCRPKGISSAMVQMKP